jgi:hypothetical protein
MVFNATLYNISVIAWQSVGGGNPEYPEKSLHYIDWTISIKESLLIAK